MATALLDIKKIRTDGGTQHRVKPVIEAISEYSSLLLDDVKLPPVVVFFDGKDYWLADGFHRVAAHMEAGIRSVPTDVRKGSLQDAFDYSLEANTDHGLRMSNEDKRNKVKAALQNEVTAALSDKELARKMRVSNHLVKSLRSGEERTVQSPAKRAAKAAAEAGKAGNIPPTGGGEQARIEGTEGVAGAADHPEQQPGDTKVTKPGTVPKGSLAEIAAERDHLREQLDEITVICQELTDEMGSLHKINAALQGGGDATAAVLEDMKQLRAQLRIAEERFAGAQNERNEAVRLCKTYKSKLDKLGKK